MSDAAKAPAPPKGLIVKSPFADYKVGDHISDPKKIAAAWLSTERHRVARWDGAEALEKDRAKLAERVAAEKKAQSDAPPAAPVATLPAPDAAEPVAKGAAA